MSDETKNKPTEGCPETLGCDLFQDPKAEWRFVCRKCQVCWMKSHMGDWYSGDWAGVFPWDPKYMSQHR